MNQRLSILHYLLLGITLNNQRNQTKAQKKEEEKKATILSNSRDKIRSKETVIITCIWYSVVNV
jgi:hypothetical protein